MRTFRQLAVGLLVFMLAVPTSAFSQERHAVPSGDLSATVARHGADQDADRAAIRDVLARPEVRDVATKAGIDLNQVSASVDRLPAGSLARVASTARDLNQALVGGASTITISTTTIILVLLIIILLLVAN